MLGWGSGTSSLPEGARAPTSPSTDSGLGSARTPLPDVLLDDPSGDGLGVSLSERGQTLETISETWDPALSRRPGGPTRLAGLPVYYDFDWPNLIGHDTAQFRNGQDLAESVVEACPDGRTPCLLLTIDDGADDGPLHTDDLNYVFVVRIHRYLEEARAGAAGSYLMRQFGVNSISVAREVRKAVTDPHRQDEILEISADRQGLTRWAERKPGRHAMLREIVGARSRLSAATGEDAPSLGATVGTWIESGGVDVARAVAKELGRTPEGRRAVAMVDPVASLARDVEIAAEGYRTLLTNEGASEADFQNYLRRHPLLLGLEYAEVMSRVKLAKAELDFVVRRHDGYRDVLELKGPGEPIIVFDGGEEAYPSRYSLGPKLARALAQVQLYKERIATSSRDDRELYGVTRDPRITIVIGRDSDLPNDTARKILRQLNVTLHRIRVLPYDILAKRAAAQLNNLLAYA